MLDSPGPNAASRCVLGVTGPLNRLRSSLVFVLAPPLSAVACVLAQAGGAPPASPLVQMLPFALIAMMAYFLFVVPQRTKQKRFQQMIDGLKENDRVVTSGGLHGVVTSVQRDANRVTLRIDEGTGTKIRVSLWALDSVEGDEPEDKKS